MKAPFTLVAPEIDLFMQFLYNYYEYNGIIAQASGFVKRKRKIDEESGKILPINRLKDRTGESLCCSSKPIGRKFWFPDPSIGIGHRFE